MFLLNRYGVSRIQLRIFQGPEYDSVKKINSTDFFNYLSQISEHELKASSVISLPTRPNFIDYVLLNYNEVL